MSYTLFEETSTVEDVSENYSNGYVKAYRSMTKEAWYRKSEHFHLWMHLLLKANHSDGEAFFGKDYITIKPGQFVTGRKALSEETGISESKVERLLSFFESKVGQIEQQKSTKNRLITIKNWHLYQSQKKGEQQVNNKRTTSEQQMDTNKNGKNDKNIYIRKFFEKEIEENIDKPLIDGYKKLVDFLYGNNDLERPFHKVLQIKDQLSYNQFEKLLETCNKNGKKMRVLLSELENYKKGSYNSVYFTLNNWAKK